MGYASSLRTSLVHLKSAVRPSSMITRREFALVSQANYSPQSNISNGHKLFKTIYPILAQLKPSRTCTSQAQKEEQQPSPDTDSIKDRILLASLKHVKECGWSEQAIVQGVRDCGYSVSAHSMFSRGGGDLALYFYQSSNEKLTQLLKQQLDTLAPDEKLNVRKFVKDAIKQRIRMTSEYSSSWPSAMAQLSHPSCAGEAVTLLSELVDEIWHLAGDKSVDMNWYTKRGLLAAIYKSSELFMLQDKSSDFEETDKFIDRRFEDSSTLTSIISNITSITPSDISGIAKSGYTVSMNVLGLKHFT